MGHTVGIVGGSVVADQSLAASCAGAYSLLDPITSLLYYFIPTWPTRFSGKKVRGKAEGDGHLRASVEQQRQVLGETATMAKVVGITRDVKLFSGKEFAGYGGKFSVVDPVIEVPTEHLFRNDGYGTFGDEVEKPLPDKEIWRYNNQQTRFLMLRSLVQIDMNDSFLKSAAKVAMAGALILLQVNPLTWPVCLGVLFLAMAFYFIVDRYAQGRIDAEAAKALMKLTLINAYKKKLEELEKSGQDHLEVPLNVAKLKKDAMAEAISVVEKQQSQNMAIKEDWQKSKGRLKRFAGNYLMDAEGNERLNIVAPSFSKRLDALKELQAEVEKETERVIVTRADLEEALLVLEGGGPQPPKFATEWAVDDAIGMGRYPLF